VELEKLLFGQDEKAAVRAEMGAPLLIQLGGVASHVKATLVGLMPESYVLIALNDKITGLENKLFEGNDVVVRYLESGTVYGFQSQIIGRVTKPHSLIFLSYPKVVARKELRHNERVPVLWPAKAEALGRVVTGAILDISSGGCRFNFKPGSEEAKVRFSPGDTLQISCQLVDVPEAILVHGSIASSKAQEGIVTLGVRFTSVDPKLLDKVKAMVQLLLDLSPLD